MEEAPAVHVGDQGGSMVDWLMKRYRNPWAAARGQTVREAMLNHAFLNNQHYVKWSQHGLKPSRRQYNTQVRMVVNLLRPLQRSVLGQVMKNEPIWDIAQVTEGFQTESLVRVGRLLLRHLWRQNRMGVLNLHGFDWLMKGGNFGKRVIFDDTMGPMVPTVKLDVNGEALLWDTVDDVERTREEAIDIIDQEMTSLAAADDPMLDIDQPELIAEKLQQRFEPLYEMARAGEVIAQLKTPFEFLADPARLDFHESDYQIIEGAYPLDWIRREFGSRAEGIEPEKNLQLLFDHQGGASLLPGLSLPKVTNTAPGRGTHIAQEVAVVREFIARKGAPNPRTGKTLENGLHFVWCQRKALVDLDNPLAYERDTELDLVDYQFLPSDNFWGPALMSDLISLVKANDRRLSQIGETMNTFIHPKLMMQRGTKVRKGSPTNAAGEIIEYLGEKPSFLEPPGVRSYVFAMLDKYMEAFNDVSMRHEVSRQGKVPANVRTAAQLQMLQEQDAEALVPTMIFFDTSEEEVATKMLVRVQEFYPDERLLSVVGANNKVESRYFRKEEFFKHDWKVFIHKGSSLPQYQAARQQRALEMLQYAPWVFINPATQMPNRRMLVQAVGANDLEGLLEELDTTRQTAEQENLLLSEGKPAVVLPFEDHEAHVEIHIAFMRSNEFKEMDSEIQKAFVQHLNEHQAYLQTQQQRMAQTAQQMQMQASVGDAIQRNNMAQGAASEARNQVRQQEAQEGGVGERILAMLKSGDLNSVAESASELFGG